MLIAAIIIVALVAALVIGHPGLRLDKVFGLLLASLAVFPVFALLVKIKRTGSPNLFLGVFVAGFFYKLIVLLVGIWLGVTRSGWDLIDFTFSCLVFMFAFQICESLYFWTKKEN